MLSAFTFREFRGINRRAAVAYVCICACICRLHPQLQRTLLVAVEKQKRHPNIRHPRDLCTPLVPLQNGIPVGTKATGRRCFSVAVLIANSTGDRCVPVPPRNLRLGAARSRPLSAPVLTFRATISRFRVPSVALKLQNNCRVASLSAIVLYSLLLGIFTR